MYLVSNKVYTSYYSGKTFIFHSIRVTDIAIKIMYTQIIQNNENTVTVKFQD
jgi:hypothetical protein